MNRLVAKILTMEKGGNMKRPEKIDHNGQGYEVGYNRACDDWESYLPSYDEIYKILERRSVYHNVSEVAQANLRAMSKDITKRIRR